MRWLILALLLLPSVALASPQMELLFAAAQKCTAYSTSKGLINGFAFIDSSGAVTDLTETITAPGTCATTLTATAECTGGSSAASVLLYINDVQVDNLGCGAGTTASKTLSATVSDTYKVRIVGAKSGTGTFKAGTAVSGGAFYVPMP